MGGEKVRPSPRCRQAIDLEAASAGSRSRRLSLEKKRE